jgi:hypothetical protein
MLLGAFRGGNPLERIVANPPTEIETAWASAQGSNGRFTSSWRTVPSPLADLSEPIGASVDHRLGVDYVGSILFTSQSAVVRIWHYCNAHSGLAWLRMGPSGPASFWGKLVTSRRPPCRGRATRVGRHKISSRNGFGRFQVRAACGVVDPPGRGFPNRTAGCYSARAWFRCRCCR